MFPWAMRRRSASGVMSTSSTCSAARTIASGIVSCCLTPVIRSTTSFTDSRCCMLSVEMTSMPASRTSATSCHRFSFRDPGTFVCAISSISATCGFRAGTLACVEHGEGLADAGGGTEVDTEPSARHDQSLILVRRHLIEREVELEHVDGLLAEHAEVPAGGVAVDQLAHTRNGEGALGRDALGLEPGVGNRDVRVEAGRRR